MLPEYNFDYHKARSNRFATRHEEQSRIVVLDPDVAEVFTTKTAQGAPSFRAEGDSALA